MSYQAITDIIVNQSQLQDFQLSAAVKNSPDSSPSVSFADILASYNEESKIEPPTASEAQNVSESEKTEKSERTGRRTGKICRIKLVGLFYIFCGENQ